MLYLSSKGVLLVSQFVCTISFASRYYVVFSTKNKAYSFRICKVLGFDPKRPDCIYHRPPRTTRATRSNLATGHDDPEWLLPKADVNVGAWFLSFEISLEEHAVTTSKEMALWFMRCLIAAYRLKKANEAITGTIVDSDSYAAGYKPQLQSKSVVNPHV